MSEPEIFGILYNIRSSENVGSIFRSADAAGVKKLYLVGYTPSPVDRFGRPNTKLAKAALGAEKSVPFEHAPDVSTVISALSSQGVSVIAVEQHSTSVSYVEYQYDGKIAFMFGNEVEGIPKSVIEECSASVEIPMHGTKESLNVSVTAGIMFFYARDKASK